MESGYAIKGIHHITLVASRAQRTVDFYLTVLGLHFVKKTVNFDRPETYHLYFGDRTGSPGTLVTFFEWPDAPPARRGIGTIDHFAMAVDSYDALLKWKTWLQHHRVMPAGPFDHRAYRSLVFMDPDGVLLEIATSSSHWKEEGLSAPQLIPRHERLATETWPEPVTEISEDMTLRRIHHIAAVSSDIERTTRFYGDTLNLPLVFTNPNPTTPADARSYWDTGAGVIAYFNPKVVPPVYGQVGHGMAHHYALAVRDTDTLEAWRTALTGQGLDVTPILDRKYFQSIYFRDPDGVLIEIATAEPGFLVDQPVERLGLDLALPPWIEPQRAQIESALPELRLPQGTAR